MGSSAILKGSKRYHLLGGIALWASCLSMSQASGDYEPWNPQEARLRLAQAKRVTGEPFTTFAQPLPGSSLAQKAKKGCKILGGIAVVGLVAEHLWKGFFPYGYSNATLRKALAISEDWRPNDDLENMFSHTP